MNENKKALNTKSKNHNKMLDLNPITLMNLDTEFSTECSNIKSYNTYLHHKLYSLTNTRLSKVIKRKIKKRLTLKYFYFNINRLNGECGNVYKSTTLYLSSLFTPVDIDTSKEKKYIKLLGSIFPVESTLITDSNFTETDVYIGQTVLKRITRITYYNKKHEWTLD